MTSADSNLRRSYQIAQHKPGDRHPDPDMWLAINPQREGSWWPAWQAWLTEHSTARVAAPPIGSPDRGFATLGDAPGAYVYQS